MSIIDEEDNTEVKRVLEELCSQDICRIFLVPSIETGQSKGK